jgi:hypothetical protein
LLRPFVELLEGRSLPSVSHFRPTFILSNINNINPAQGPGGVGLTPDQVRTAYGINSITFSGGTITGDGTGQTIAIVDAFNDPNIVGDLNFFDQNVYLSANDLNAGKTLYNRYGAASSFFTVYDQNGNVIDPGNTSVPNSNGNGWSVEESLDVEWAHSIAPGAKIDLVECNSNSSANLYPGVVKAGGLANVSAVSMSWGSGEFSGETGKDSDFVHAGVTFLASTGDSGAPGGYPAYSPNVVAVGGTTLTLNADNTWKSEKGWSGSGGGASTQESEPSYQNNVQTTNKRTIPDVALDADNNNSPVAIWDSYDFGSWVGVGGTSLACPCWAGLVAVTNQGRLANGGTVLNTSSGTQTQTFLYSLHSTDFHDNLGGSNGTNTTGLTNPAVYDEVTGLGSPVANTLVPDLASMGVVVNKPTVTKISPTTGPDNGNTSVIITGTSFTAATAVDFGSNAALSFVVNSDTQLTAVSPAGAVGTVDVTVVNPAGTSATSAADQFTYFAVLTLSPSSLSAATANKSYSQTITATGGSGSYTFSLASGTLPQGFTLTSGGVLSGTTPTAGAFNFTVQATDNNQSSLTGSQAYAFTVNPAGTLTISPTTLPIATAKDAYGPITFTATGGFGSYTFSVLTGTKLPPGLTLTSAGVLSGTPTTAGTYTFTIDATDKTQNSLSGSQTYTMTVNKAITIAPATLPIATVTNAYKEQLKVAGGSGTGYTFALASSSSLPAGLTMNSAGLITGTPTASGKFTFTIIATDSIGATGTKTYTLTIDPAITISPTTLPAATIGQAYSEQLTASGGSGKLYVFKATGLPIWLKLSSTGLLSGTPPSNAPASVTFTVTVTDSAKGKVSEPYTLTINP